MFNNINFSKFLLFFVCWIILIVLINPYTINGQERFLLTEAEMSGYELKRQSMTDWIIGEGDQMHNAIQQKWRVNGGDERDNIYIEYCEFNTEPEAICGTAYASHTFATLFIWGSHTGAIFGDGTWIAISGGSVFFVRGNVGIKINIRIDFDKNDFQLLLLLSNKLLNKIESKLSPEVFSFEEAARQKQIPMEVYQTITDPVVNSEIMNGFSLHTTWDSKWLFESDSLALGIRKEWKNEQGSIVGIDISKFDSDACASKAGEIQSRNTYISPRVFSLDNLDSLKSILTEWQKEWYNFNKNLFSVVGIKSNIAVHVYLFEPIEIDTSFFYSIIEKLAEQISNF